MRRFLKRYAGVLILVLTLLVVVLVTLRDGNIEDTWHSLRAVRPEWALAALLGWCAFVFSRGYTMRRYLHLQGQEAPLRECLHASVIGLFYSGITPAASGGQPMQVYYLYKAGVPVSLGASGAIVKFIGFQTALLLLAGAGLGCEYSFVRQTAGGSFWLIIVGFVCNAAVVLAVFLLLVSRRTVNAIVRFGLNTGTRLHLIRDRAAAEEKIFKLIENYLVSMNSLRDRPKALAEMFVLSVVQVLSYSSILWAVYHAFGLSGASAAQLITIQLLLYQTVSYVPLPGASGAQEGLFCLLLAPVVPYEKRIGMMLGWRFFTFYITILAGILLTGTDGIRALREKRK